MVVIKQLCEVGFHECKNKKANKQFKRWVVNLLYNNAALSTSVNNNNITQTSS